LGKAEDRDQRAEVGGQLGGWVVWQRRGNRRMSNIECRRRERRALPCDRETTPACGQPTTAWGAVGGAFRVGGRLTNVSFAGFTCLLKLLAMVGLRNVFPF